jgi:hypothetical protein
MYAAADATSALSGTAQYNPGKVLTYLKNSCDGLDGGRKLISKLPSSRQRPPARHMSMMINN